MYFVEKTKKLVFWNNLLNQKGCDASNVYDEEIIEPSEQDFSDDEQEKEYKRIVKKVRNNRKRKRRDGDKSKQHIIQPDHVYKKREVKHLAMNNYPSAAPVPYNYCHPPVAYAQNMQQTYNPGYVPNYSPIPAYQPQGGNYIQNMPQQIQPVQQDPNYHPQAQQNPNYPSQTQPNPPYGYPPYSNQPK